MHKIWTFKENIKSSVCMRKRDRWLFSNWTKQISYAKRYEGKKHLWNGKITHELNRIGKSSLNSKKNQTEELHFCGCGCGIVSMFQRIQLNRENIIFKSIDIPLALCEVQLWNNLRHDMCSTKIVWLKTIHSVYISRRALNIQGLRLTLS